MKAAPTDRLQTENELATSEAQRLKMLEADRVKRMQPDGGVVGGGGGGGGAKGGGAVRGPTDDDLVDDFGPLPGDAPDYILDRDAAGMMRKMDRDDVDDDDDDDEDEDEEDEEEGLMDEEDEEDEDDDDDEDDDMEEEEESEEDEDEDEDAEVVIRPQKPRASATATPAATSARSPAGDEELPYVFACPSDAAGLNELMRIAGPNIERQKEVLHRLIAGHHTHLRESNRAKLTTLAGLLLDRMDDLASAPPPKAMPKAMPKGKKARAQGGDERELINPASMLQPLAPALHTIVEQMPIPISLLLLERLQVRGLPASPQISQHLPFCHDLR